MQHVDLKQALIDHLLSYETVEPIVVTACTPAACLLSLDEHIPRHIDWNWIKASLGKNDVITRMSAYKPTNFEHLDKACTFIKEHPHWHQIEFRKANKTAASIAEWSENVVNHYAKSTKHHTK